MSQMLDVIIIGSGPAGLSAAIYAKRAGMNCILLEKTGISGGQILSTYEVDNYPGIPLVSGFDLAEKFREHVERLGVECKEGDVLRVICQPGSVFVETTQANYITKAIVVATGANHAKLGVKGEEELAGMGVSYCATCDGAFFKGRTVAVVGGGNVALEDAIFLARTCEKVYLIHRREELRGAKILQEALFKLPNVEILWNTEVKEICGEDMVENLLIYNKKNDTTDKLAIQGVFIAVGIIPNTDFLKGIVQMDEHGYVVADETCQTSAPGIYVAGDARTKQLRQVVTATADGANAIASVEQYFINMNVM